MSAEIALVVAATAVSYLILSLAIAVFWIGGRD